MRFVLLMAEEDHYEKWHRIGDAERAAVFAAFAAFSAAVSERGTVVSGEGLAAPSEAVTLRPGPDRAVTAGPYAETAEQVGGLWIVDLPDLGTTLELARLLPESFSVEVRPTTDG
ncbi:YciI family protein [Nocardioides sp. W7]|uniref:YciI family protein n=1 Tax=Nocardioides sp. W7 TaxID=2931390 RepID=UPI001FD02723|nr:YciI family protein [Nocardioides sp. W7]